MRRLTLFDLMILVAATGVGLGMARLYEINYQAPSHYRFLDWLRGPPSCTATAIAIALIGLRLRRPRPRAIRLLQQPGFTACLAVLLGAVLGIVFHSAHLAARIIVQGSRGYPIFNYFWHGVILHIPLAVVGIWLTLMASRRWRAEPSWIDRLGRLIGFYWFAYVVIDPVAPIVALLLPFLP
jgi:hypothetical protein